MSDQQRRRRMNSSRATCFDFYGLRVAVECEDDDVLEDIHRDFSYFGADPREPMTLVQVISDASPRGWLPQLKAVFQTPRNAVYRNGDSCYVDYFGNALAICRRKERKHKIYCCNRDLAHEIAFLTILSQVGQHLDTIGLHRVHALGVEAGGRAVLILLPMAGGKTTLALQLLASEGIKLLSEDSPLVSRDGEVFPFPLRIGVRVGAEPPGIPSEYLRTVKRMEFGPKTLIDIEYFRGKIAAPCPVGAILLGERWLAGPSSICPERRGRALKAFIKNSVVGLGLYQGMEFVFERTAWEILGKASIAFSRFRNSLEVIRRSRVYNFAMGPNVEQSAQVLAEFIRESSSHSQS